MIIYITRLELAIQSKIKDKNRNELIITTIVIQSYTIYINNIMLILITSH